jgi:hypothetical protein
VLKDALFMADHVLLEAGDDLVRQLSHEREAVKAVLELVWNSLDADATEVDVTLERSGTTGVNKIVVADDGDGITPEKARTAFKQVGNSDKRVGGTTDRLQRPLHGKAGRGRLRAFALGDATRWTSTARAVDSRLMRTTIESEISRRTTWRIDTQPAPEMDHPGTKVELWGKQASHLNKLLEPKAAAQITAALAPYLLTWTDVRVIYDGQRIDPQTQIQAEEFEDLTFDYEGQTHPFHIRLIHWRTGAERTIALCDAASAPVESLDVSAEHADFSYTAYVLWEPMPRHRNEIPLITLGGDTPLAPLLRTAREWIGARLEERRRRQRRQLVERWIEEGVYPYSRRPEGDQARAEQATFDLVATSINRHITGDRMKKRLTLSLLQNSLRHNPDEMVEILEKVLSLGDDDVSHLHGLLQQTSLSNIIRASSIVTSRLQFLTALEHLVFDVETYGVVKERDHLHKILERELWVFGEEFNRVDGEQGPEPVPLRLARPPRLQGRGRHRGGQHRLRQSPRHVPMLSPQTIRRMGGCHGRALSRSLGGAPPPPGAPSRVPGAGPGSNAAARQVRRHPGSYGLLSRSPTARRAPPGRRTPSGRRRPRPPRRSDPALLRALRSSVS